MALAVSAAKAAVDSGLSERRGASMSHAATGTRSPSDTAAALSPGDLTSGARMQDKAWARDAPPPADTDDLAGVPLMASWTTGLGAAGRVSSQTPGAQSGGAAPPRNTSLVDEEASRRTRHQTAALTLCPMHRHMYPTSLMIINSWFTQLKAQGPSRTCNESKEEEGADAMPLDEYSRRVRAM